MTEREQIEEMAKDIFKSGVAIDGLDLAFAAVHGADMTDSHFMRIAQYLYNAGYRKQSEGSSARGEWVYSEIYCTYICSECEECASVDDFREPRLTNFCPNCGAKMKGVNYD